MARPLEKLVKVLHSESVGSWFKLQPCYPAPGDLRVKYWSKVSYGVVNSLGKLAEGENCMLSLSQLSYLWDLEEHMSQGGGGFLNNFMGAKPKRGRAIFYRGS